MKLSIAFPTLAALLVLLAPPVLAQVAQESGYVLDYQLSVPAAANFNGGSVPYSTNNSGSIVTGSFDRVAYELTLSGSTNPNSPNGNIWASFDPQSTAANQLGVPIDTSGEVYGGNGVVQFVNNMTVITDSGFSSLAGTGITNGNIQFWSTNYGPNGSTGNFDWANSGGGTSGPNYGSMTISEVNPANHAQGQMLISYNNWGGDGGDSDLGLGNSTLNASGVNANYTFRHNASDYTSAILTVWVHPVPEPSTVVLFGLGAVGLFAVARRRRRSAKCLPQSN